MVAPVRVTDFEVNESLPWSTITVERAQVESAPVVVQHSGTGRRVSSRVDRFIVTVLGGDEGGVLVFVATIRGTAAQQSDSSGYIMSKSDLHLADSFVIVWSCKHPSHRRVSVVLGDVTGTSRMGRVRISLGGEDFTVYRANPSTMIADSINDRLCVVRFQPI